MSSSKRTRKTSSRNFRIVARGVRRDEADISRLMKAALDQYRKNASPDRAVSSPPASSDEVES